MKAVAVFPAEKQVRIVDHPEPGINSPDQVKLRMRNVGICGTDKEIVSFQYGTPPDGSEYLIIGHESLGEVVEAGNRQFKPGDLIIPTVRRPCPHPECIACRSGRQDFCYTGDFTERGIKQQHGYMAEFVVEDAAYLNLVPAALREIAVLVEPLTIAEKGLAQLMEVQQRLPWFQPGQGQEAVVLGAGPVGLLGAMALRVRGFEVFIYSRPGEDRQAIATAIGAKFINADEVTVDSVVNEFVTTLDVVYEAVGASSLAFDFLKALGPNGVFIFTGVPGRKAPVPVDTDLLMRDLVLKNQLLFGTVNAPKVSFEAAIADLGKFEAAWPGVTGRLISNRIPLEKALEPLAGKIPGIKNVIEIRS